MIKARTRAALAVKKSRLERIGQVPYGWRLSPDGVHHEAHGDEQAVLIVAQRHRARGLSLRAIAAQLEAAGLSPRSGRSWYPQMIANMLAARAIPSTGTSHS